MKGLTNRHEGIHEGCQMKGENGRVSQRVGNIIEGSYTKGKMKGQMKGCSYDYEDID